MDSVIQTGYFGSLPAGGQVPSSPLPLLLPVPSRPGAQAALAKTMLIFFLVNAWSVHNGWCKGKDEAKLGFLLETSRLWEMQHHSIVHVRAHELLQCQILKSKLWTKTNPEKNSSASGHWDWIFYCQWEMQHPADGQSKQLEEKCSNIFWKIMRRWVRAHLIMPSWHSEHFAALTSLKAEQIAQLNPSAETNHVNQICIKPPKKSKEHIALGPAPRD